MELDEEDAILSEIDKKNLIKLSSKLRKCRRFNNHENLPLNKKIEQKEHIQKLEKARSSKFTLYHSLRTQLNVIPEIQIDPSQQIIISFFSTRQSKKPHINFTFPHNNYQKFIKDSDPINKRILFYQNDSHFVFNSFPTCIFHVPKCDSFAELKNICHKLKHQTTKSKRIIKTQQIVKDIVFFTLTESEEPPYQAEKSPEWGEMRSQDSIYQDLHPLIKKYYNGGRIRIIKLGDKTTFYDEFHQKWLKFHFYPIMYDRIAHYFDSFRAESTKSTIQSI